MLVTLLGMVTLVRLVQRGGREKGRREAQNNECHEMLNLHRLTC